MKFPFYIYKKKQFLVYEWNNVFILLVWEVMKKEMYNLYKIQFVCQLL